MRESEHNEVFYYVYYMKSSIQICASIKSSQSSLESFLRQMSSQDRSKWKSLYVPSFQPAQGYQENLVLHEVPKKYIKHKTDNRIEDVVSRRNCVSPIFTCFLKINVPLNPTTALPPKIFF